MSAASCKSSTGRVLKCDTATNIFPRLHIGPSDSTTCVCIYGYIYHAAMYVWRREKEAELLHNRLQHPSVHISMKERR
jgi:hypothetical protein